MSFGLAFAQGLVGGFRKNIEREQQARATDDERYAGLQDMLFKGTMEAAKDGKPMPKFIGDKLRDAKKQIDDRPDIGLFGTGVADRLNIDMTELAGNINNIKKYGRTYGTGGYLLGFRAEDKFDEKNSRNFTSEVVGLTRNEDGLAKIRKLKEGSQAEFDRFISAVQSASAVLVEKAQLANPNKDKNYQIKVRNITNKNHPLFGIDKVFDIQAGDNNEIAKKGALDLSRNVIITSELAKLKKEKKPIPSFMTIVDSGEDQNLVVPIFLSNPKDLAQAKKMSTNFNIPPKGNVFDYWHNKHVTLPGMKPEDKTRYFKYSLAFGRKISSIENLDPDKDLFRLLADEKAAFDVYQKMINETDGKSISQVYALSPYMTGPNKHLDIAPPPAGSVYGIVTNPYSKEEYAAEKYYSKNKLDSENFSSMKVKYQDVDKVEKNLGVLYGKIENLDKNASAPMMYQSFKNSLEAVFSLDGGIVGGIVQDVTSYKNDDENKNKFDEKELTSGYLKELAYRGNDNRNEEVAQIQALRITLAFQMARAADPSGRLSNQDIEQQMAKLGGNLATPPAMMAALRITLREFQEQKQKLALLIKFGQGSDPATDTDFKLIDAVVAHDALRENYMRFKNKGSNIVPDSKILNKEETYKDGDTDILRYLLTEDGKFYIDQITMTEIPISRFKTQ